MSIKRYCDVCGNEITKHNSTNGNRLKYTSEVLNLEIITGNRCN